MKFSAKKMLTALLCGYACLSLAWFFSTYCRMVLHDEPFQLPALAVYMAVGNLVLFIGVITGLYDSAYELRGLRAPGEKTANICRALMLSSLLNCVISFIWLYMASTSPNWDKGSAYAEGLIGQVFSSIQISLSLLIFLYSLFGINSIASERLVQFYRDPFSALRVKRRKSR